MIDHAVPFIQQQRNGERVCILLTPAFSNGREHLAEQFEVFVQSFILFCSGRCFCEYQQAIALFEMLHQRISKCSIIVRIDQLAAVVNQFGEKSGRVIGPVASRVFRRFRLCELVQQSQGMSQFRGCGQLAPFQSFDLFGEHLLSAKACQQWIVGRDIRSTGNIRTILVVRDPQAAVAVGIGKSGHGERGEDAGLAGRTASVNGKPADFWHPRGKRHFVLNRIGRFHFNSPPFVDCQYRSNQLLQDAAAETMQSKAARSAAGVPAA